MQNIACGFQVNNRRACNGSAITICEICRGPTCLEHALVASNADAVCLRCVNSIYQRVHQQIPETPPGPRPQAVPDATPTPAQLRKVHFKTLRLRETATLDEVKARYKKLALKAHPDRGGSATEFHRITKAYEWITQVHFAP